MSSENRSVPVGYCQCGCGEKTTFSKKTGKQNRYVHAGHANRRNVGYVIDPATGCWLWQGHRNRHGYGRLYHRDLKKPYLAHRFYYEQAKGEIGDVPLDHLCRNPGCVNPDHLEPCSTPENVRRGVRAKLTWDDVRLIRTSPLTNLELGHALGVSNSTVCNIRKGRAWPESQAPWNEAR